MEYCDSRRIKEIRDNTAKMADAFTRIADALERLADRKTENSSEKPNNCEDDEYWKHLFIEVVKGHMSDAEANQAWYEYINHKDEPQTEKTCTNCKHNGVVSVPKCDECHDMDKHEFIESQTDCPWR